MPDFKKPVIVDSDIVMRLKGACPWGCGDTLVVLGDGGIGCTNDVCPEPFGVNRILADGMTEHLIKLGDEGFTMKHPLKERVGGRLMSCPVSDWLSSLTAPPQPPGLYYAVEAFDSEANTITLTWHLLSEHLEAEPHDHAELEVEGGHEHEEEALNAGD